MAFTRRFAFRSVHSLDEGDHREQLHGHEYFLEVTCTDSDEGEVRELVQREVLAPFHARDMRKTIQPATGEVLVNWIHDRLEKTTLAPRLLGVALQETRKNRFVSAKSRGHLL